MRGWLFYLCFNNDEDGHRSTAIHKWKRTSKMFVWVLDSWQVYFWRLKWKLCSDCKTAKVISEHDESVIIKIFILKSSFNIVNVEDLNVAYCWSKHNFGIVVLQAWVWSAFLPRFRLRLNYIWLLSEQVFLLCKFPLPYIHWDLGNLQAIHRCTMLHGFIRILFMFLALGT